MKSDEVIELTSVRSFSVPDKSLLILGSEERLLIILSAIGRASLLVISRGVASVSLNPNPRSAVEMLDIVEDTESIFVISTSLITSVSLESVSVIFPIAEALVSFTLLIAVSIPVTLS